MPKLKWIECDPVPHFSRDYPGNCIAAAISNATGVAYVVVYETLLVLARKERPSKRFYRSSRKHGFRRSTYDKLLRDLGAKWVPKNTRLSARLPKKKLVVSVPRHATAIVGHKIYDTFDPRRNGQNRVYGYYILPERRWRQTFAGVCLGILLSRALEDAGVRCLGQLAEYRAWRARGGAEPRVDGRRDGGTRYARP
jgi:hypothetical protein